jgi:hypothetical protein
VLDSLDRIDSALQAELPKRCQQREGFFATIFMDFTAAWFVVLGKTDIILYYQLDTGSPGQTIFEIKIRERFLERFESI